MQMVQGLRSHAPSGLSPRVDDPQGRLLPTVPPPADSHPPDSHPSLRGKTPGLLVSSPRASDSLAAPGRSPACVSRRTVVATIAVVWKSFFGRTASPHRKENSWFGKTKSHRTAQGGRGRPSGSRSGRWVCESRRV